MTSLLVKAFLSRATDISLFYHCYYAVFRKDQLSVTVLYLLSSIYLSLFHYFILQVDFKTNTQELHFKITNYYSKYSAKFNNSTTVS